MAGRRLSRKLLLLIGSLLFALLLCEFAFRLLWPAPFEGPRTMAITGDRLPLGEMAHFLRPYLDELPPEHPPRGYMTTGLRFLMGYDRPQWSYFDEHGAVEVAFNSLGFRDLEFPIEKREGEFRVIAIGDSFTVGFGVRLEDTWVQRLERALAAGRDGPVEVINAGWTHGMTAAGYHPWLAKEGVRFAPDLVVVGFCLNDMAMVPMVSYPAVRPADVAKDLGWLGSSRLLVEIVRGIRQRDEVGRRRDFGDLVRGDPAIWNDCQQGLRATRDVLAAHGVPLVVAIFPMLSDLRSEHNAFASLHGMVRTFCTAEGIRHVDLLPAFTGRDEQSLWVHATDQHPNDAGHAIIAEALFDYLQQQGLAGRGN